MNISVSLVFSGDVSLLSTDQNKLLQNARGGQDDVLLHRKIDVCILLLLNKESENSLKRKQLYEM